MRGDDRAPGDDARIGVAFRRSLVAFAVIAVAGGAAVLLLNRQSSPEARVDEKPVSGPQTRAAANAAAPPVRFTDITRAAGIDFVHFNGATGDKLLPETMGGGVAFLDYDGDGDQDLLFVNSAPWPGAAAPTPPPTMKLYRNDGRGTFEDTTVEAGLDISFYGMGVSVGDYNGDAYDDVFISAVGRGHLFRNERGTFRDVTDAAGVGGDPNAWSTSSAFFDYDNDGDLDLFVANYVAWSRDIDFEIDFRLDGIGRAYGPPVMFQGSHPYLYRNDGNGTFTDVSAASGIEVLNSDTGVPVAKALGIAPIDVDGDGWLDLFVANDTVRNFLLRNRRDGTFEEVGTRVGVAFDRNGQATGAMGIDIAYYRNDSDLAVAIGNFANEMTSFYVSQGRQMLFADDAITEGVGAPTRLALTFGLFFFDYDLDGRLDLLQVNGHIEDEINTVQASQHYEQPAQLFWNCASCTSTFVRATAGDLDRPLVGRGAAFADIDADGDLDVVVTQIARPPVLLRNDQNLGHHWIRVQLVGSRANRNAIGAWIEVEGPGSIQRRQVMPTRSYLSQVELPVTFGLGKATTVGPLRVRWPDGTTRVIDEVAADSVIRIDYDDDTLPK